MRTRRVVAFALVTILFSPLISGVSAQWEEDGWLENIIAPERLARGDEIGCHGIPDVDIRFEPLAITECRDYLTQRTNASQWGENPLSFGQPPGAWTSAALAAVESQGFLAVGGQPPAEGEQGDLQHFPDNGGSLEKNIGSAAQFQSAVNSGADNINLFWQARQHDVVVRADSDLVEAVELTGAWYTTWGELTSYEYALREFSVSQTEAGVLQVEYPTYTGHPNGWDVPITNLFSGLSQDVVSVVGPNGELPELSPNQPHLQEGWQQSAGDNLYLTLASGTSVTITFETQSEVEFSLSTSPKFNGHNLSITVSGIHANDLFDWSRKWKDTPMLFTWLVEPKGIEPFSWLLPAVAIVVALAAPAAIIWLVRNDQRAQQVVNTFDSLGDLQFAEE